jgi:nitrate reductase gamma subunit
MMLDTVLFVIFPYAAVLLAVVVTAYRYFKKPFSYSSLSSQFLESGELFYGSVPWHIGIMGAIAGHVIGFIFPKQVLWFNGVPARLYILEVTGLLFGLLALVGLVNLIMRRHRSARVRAVTSRMDIAVLLLLLIQVALGVFIAVFYRWGSSWYAVSLVPYLRSLILLQPDIQMIVPLPVGVKLHILNAYLLVAIFGFSRLVHMLVVPIHYLWRPYQVVVWNWNRKRIRGQAPRPRPQVAERPLPVGEPASDHRPVYTR